MAKINNRDHQRFDFVPGTWVKIVRPTEDFKKFKMYPLIDISQGGMSFKTHKVAEYKRGDEIIVLEIEHRTMKEMIKGVVRYVQNLDEHGIDYKFGVEFLGKV
jgi:c-di-GMP-binding flagellar brake protein YcgR